MLPPPSTPDRGRSRTRYPAHLSRDTDTEGKPRPLLHRRETSHMYETLEDLLREAGYKETRVFTPEGERLSTRKKDAPTSGVGGAVVKLFSTWMSNKKTGTGSDLLSAPGSCPPTPRTRPRTRTPLSTLPGPSTINTSNSAAQLARLQQQQLQHTLSLPRAACASSSSSLAALNNPNSRARLALRHAASAPYMDKRRSRTQPRTPRAPKSKAPPLPATWLASLSAALLSPRASRPTSPTTPTAPQTQASRPAVLTHRTPTSVAAVTITNVVCRSAPSSRSSSAVRPPKAKSRLPVPVPTLAQTCVCEEQAPAAAVWPPHSPHHLPRDAVAPGAIPPLDYDDDDEELDLTMMLIPSKRQHSIRSLRSVMQQHHGSFTRSMTVHYSQPREETARGRATMRRRIEESECEDEAAENENGDGRGGGHDDDEQGHWDSGEFLTAKFRRRRNHLPRQWGWPS